jgi:hypothetical protein
MRHVWSCRQVQWSAGASVVFARLFLVARVALWLWSVTVLMADPEQVQVVGDAVANADR